MKILLEMGAWECMQRHPSRTWIRISFVTFGSRMAKEGLINCKMKTYQRPPDQGCGAEARASSVHCGRDRGGVCNLSLTQAGDRLHSVILKPGVPSPPKKYRCICAMCSWGPQLWLLWAIAVRSHFPGDNANHQSVCQLFRKLCIQSIAPSGMGNYI